MTKKLKLNSAMTGFMDGVIPAENELNSIINQALVFASGSSSLNKEIGGKIILNENNILLTYLRNNSENKKRFISEILQADLYAGDLKGFWHTHHSHSFPSLPDLYQMIRLNIMCKKNFLMIIIGRKKVSITTFRYLIFPGIKFELIKNGK